MQEETMELFELSATYEVLLEIGQAVRPVRIEIFRGRKNAQKLRARVWEQSTYNLYPTFGNIKPDGGLENRLMSCAQVNREISALVAEEPEMLLGGEWDSEEAFLERLKEFIVRYQAMCSKNA